MKKICFALCFILMMPMFLVGCSNKESKSNIKEDFVDIQSIEYTTFYTEEGENYFGQKNTKLNSRFYIKADIKNVSETEYISSSNLLESYEYKKYIDGALVYDGHSYVSIGPTNINKEKDNVPNFEESKLNIGKSYYEKYDKAGSTYYRCYTIRECKIIYIKLKIISDSVIEIINDNSHYIVQTVYYQASFFN